MSYEEFDFGELISSTKLNANYAALSQDLTTTATTLQGNITNLDNSVTTLGNRINNPDVSFKTTLLNLLYPIGSIYTTTSTASTCPIQTELGGTWARVAENRVLQGGNGVTDTNRNIAAGLPQHYHTDIYLEGSSDDNGDPGTLVVTHYNQDNGQHKIKNSKTGNANNTIYGQSNTVQPPAYTVNHWRRTA